MLKLLAVEVLTEEEEEEERNTKKTIPCRRKRQGKERILQRQNKTACLPSCNYQKLCYIMRQITKNLNSVNLLLVSCTAILATKVTGTYTHDNLNAWYAAAIVWSFNQTICSQIHDLKILESFIPTPRLANNNQNCCWKRRGHFRPPFTLTCEVKDLSPYFRFAGSFCESETSFYVVARWLFVGWNERKKVGVRDLT